MPRDAGLGVLWLPSGTAGVWLRAPALDLEPSAAQGGLWDFSQNSVFKCTK